MEEIETKQPKKKSTPKQTVDEFLATKPPLGNTRTKLFRQKSIGCNDLDKLYKEFI